MSHFCKWAVSAGVNAEGAMKPETVPRQKSPLGQEAKPPNPRSLPPAKSPVYLVLLWPDQSGEWEGRIKDARTGVEQPFHELGELLSWLNTHKQERRKA